MTPHWSYKVRVIWPRFWKGKALMANFLKGTLLTKKLSTIFNNFFLPPLLFYYQRKFNIFRKTRSISCSRSSLLLSTVKDNTIKTVRKSAFNCNTVAVASKSFMLSIGRRLFGPGRRTSFWCLIVPIINENTFPSSFIPSPWTPRNLRDVQSDTIWYVC